MLFYFYRYVVPTGLSIKQPPFRYRAQVIIFFTQLAVELIFLTTANSVASVFHSYVDLYKLTAQLGKG